MARTIGVAGVELALEERGAGPPLLFLHGGDGLRPELPWLELLSRRHRVIAPTHPGFGASSLPDWIGSVDDLAYLYLDLADKLDLREATLVGAAFGGWVAAEMLVRSNARFRRLVLASPLGIKVSGRETRDIADMHAMSEAEYRAHAWADPEKGRIDARRLSEAEVRGIVTGREAICLFGWRPYMHNPRLKPWLHRIDRPALLIWGAADRILSPAYRSGWAEALRGSRSVTIPAAGHWPHWEAPEAFAAAVDGFTGR